MANVLVVDDDADTAEMLAAALSKAGHEVESAADGQQALTALVAGSKDLIVLDLRMPVMDGVTFMQIMRSYLRWTHLPVVLVTAAEREEIDRAESLDVARVFRKANYRLGELVDTVGSLTASA